jgi:TonB family protein
MKKLILLPVLLLLGGGNIAAALEGEAANREGQQSLRIHQTTSIVFPYTLLNRGIVSGDARVALSVAPDGSLTDLLIVGYSHREFADATLQAVQKWRYEPMLLNGSPVATRVILDVNFEAQGVVLSINPGTDLEAYVLAFRRGPHYGPCALRELDGIPTPLETIAPAYPQDMALHGVKGSAVVDFYIDESGAVRMAAVTQADFWELGALAVAAVEQWKFAPPTRHGKPVLVRAQQRFVFGQKES